MKIPAGYFVDNQPIELKDYCFCGDGWYLLIEELTKKLLPIVKREKIKDWCITLIKEKFGGLRYYISCGTDEMYDLIHKAEKKSRKTCEVCGGEGRTIHGGYWYMTRCPDCAPKK